VPFFRVFPCSSFIIGVESTKFGMKKVRYFWLFIIKKKLPEM
jgi:hypothetical protein